VSTTALDQVAHAFIDAGGIRTHYLEAGAGEPLVLLHSAEFSGRSEFSWRHNITALAEHFHVFAPDMVGFGGTEKVFNFSDRAGFRVRHIRAFMDAVGIDSAHFMGNSFGGSILQTVAADDQPAWGIRSIVSVSGGGNAPDNAARRVLTDYDGTREGMRALMQVLFWDARWWSDDLVEERWLASNEPGAWEAVAAARLARPGQDKGFSSSPRGDVSKIKVPILIVGGAEDLLREPGCWEDLHRQIPASQLKVFSPARHCPHIEYAQEFNALAIDFLKRNS
jgi:pimeloyl-ACP methyl ester carboxylesterase